MTKKFKIPNTSLLKAGLELMKQNGVPLKRAMAWGRSMIFTTPKGETVRVRTCNDHVLVTLASGPKPGAKLSIEGTDYLLIVMPEEKRTPGPIEAYFIPTEKAAKDVRKAHETWLKSNPKTKGNNVTWNLWFDEGNFLPSTGFRKKWKNFRLEGNASTIEGPKEQENASSERFEGKTLGEIISRSKTLIAGAAGVSPDNVKISIDMG